MYLDEVQDFSYAAIYLICSIGGKSSLHWVCAGDTAQMVSPGCAFKFTGLKQTLLSVQSGIEGRLGKVSHLLVNYRTSQAILEVANAILDSAKKHFPGAIEYAQPERAVKNTGIEVALCDWNAALSMKVSFGHEQALIYSSGGDTYGIALTAKDWLGDHPFILSSVESKGLEFDDVVVAFDNNRKVWDVESERVASLRMLRELYVAITRAKRRAVILVNRNCDTMVKFFTELGCDLEFTPVEFTLVEFDSETSISEWLKKGHALFADESYSYAAKCFNKARDDGYSFWASARHQQKLGRRIQAVPFLWNAVDSFYNRKAFTYALNAIEEILNLSVDVSWISRHDLIDGALQKLPDYLPRVVIVRLAIARNKWEDVKVDDMKNIEASNILIKHRGNPALKAIVKRSRDTERTVISNILPK